MEDRSSTIQKETLNGVECGWAQFFEDAKSKSLSDRRLDTIKHSVRSSMFHPTQHRSAEINDVAPLHIEHTHIPLRLPNVLIVQGPKMALPRIVHFRAYMTGTEHRGWITGYSSLIWLWKSSRQTAK
jgi:hypothetical protein